MSQLMCELCYEDAKEVGLICPCYALIFYQDKYHILSGEGHKGHIIFTFENVPWPDPDPECKDDLDDESEKEAMRWTDEAAALHHMKLHPHDGYALFSTYMKERRDGFFSMWLFDKCGKLIKESQ